MAKKIAALALAALLLITVMAGCNSKQHYIEPEEFESYYYPQSSDESVKFAAGANSLQIVMNTPTAEAGVGKVGIYKLSDDSLVEEYDLREAKNIYIQNNTKTKTSAIVILLKDKFFEAGESYYVTAPDGAFYVDDIKGCLDEIKKGDWVFHIAEYGIDGDINAIPTTYLVGDSIKIPVKVDGQAAQAVLTIYDEMLTGAEIRSLSAPGVFEVSAKAAGTARIGVMYLDEGGRWLDGTVISVTIK